MGLWLAPLFSLLEIHSEAVEAKKGHNILPQGYIFLWRLSRVKEFVKYFLTSKSDIFPSATGSVSKESACTAGDLGLIPRLGRSPGGGKMKTHSSILAWRIPMGRRTWRAAVHGVAESQTRPSTQHSTAQATSYCLGSWKK